MYILRLILYDYHILQPIVVLRYVICQLIGQYKRDTGFGWLRASMNIGEKDQQSQNQENYKIL